MTEILQHVQLKNLNPRHGKHRFNMVTDQQPLWFERALSLVPFTVSMFIFHIHLKNKCYLTVNTKSVISANRC